MKKNIIRVVVACCALAAAMATRSQSIYEPYAITTLAGLALSPGASDDTGALARFDQPWGVAVDGGGNVYVADTLNHTIRKIASGGIVSTLAGVAGSPGFADGPANLAQFSRPTGVAVNSAGTMVYVADYNNHVIRQISGGSVTTLAGTVGVSGINDGTGTSAQFRNPFGVAVNSAGTAVYVTDQNNQTIRMIEISSGIVTTLAGSPNLAGSADGANSAARFNTPRGIAVDIMGNLYVADGGNLTVRKIDLTVPGGVVSTLAGQVFIPGFNDGPGSGALFSILTPMGPFGGPCGVAVDNFFNVYVTDQGNHTIRKIAPGGNVTTLAGLASTSGSADDVGIAARFNYPAGVAVDGAGMLFVADAANHTIRTGVKTNCVEMIGARDKTVKCGAAWDFDAPTNIIDSCCTNYTLSFGTVTNGFCPLVVTRTWVIGDVCGNTNTCRQTVTVVDATPPVLTCATNKTAECGTPWNFDPPTGVDACSGTNVTITILNTVTNGICPLVVTRTWIAADACGNTNSCSQTVTVSPASRCVPGDVWTAHETNRIWTSVASSSDGSKLVAVAFNDQIYTSTDSGTSWTAHETNRAWWSVASSTDGSKLAAVVSHGQIYTSTDSGMSWTARETNRSWLSLASSSDGSRLVAVADNDAIFTSADFGVTWAPHESNRAWRSAASSGDGSKLIAVAYNGQIYTSADFGATWAPHESNRQWYSVASSDNGSMLVAAEYGGLIYTSIDSGANWTAQVGSGNRNWSKIASSSDGTKLVAVVYNGQVYTSIDSGMNWTARESSRYWMGIASSSDGTKLVAVVYGGGLIYTSACTSGPAITSANNKTVECGARWSFDPPVAVDSCSGARAAISVLNTVTNGVCPLTITRTWQATDACGNSSTCSQTVTVVNSSLPVVLCPKDIVVTSCVLTQLFYTVTAMDGCNTNLTAVCSPPSGSSFTPGTTTTVLCVATNCNGSAKRSFNVTVVCSTNPCVPAPANMVLWLPFDETNGTTSVNLVPGGNNGAQVNSPVVNSGYVANSLSFNGVDQYVSATDYPAINPGTGDLSIDAWVKRDPNSGTVPRIIVDKRDSQTAIGYSLAVSWGNLLFQMGSPANNFTNYRDTGIVPADDQWHLVAVTVNRNSTNGGRFYVDGNPTGIFDPTDHPGSLDNTTSFLVGNTLVGGAALWMGGIDEVEMFNRALEPDEIAVIFKVGAAGKCKTPCAIPLSVTCPADKVEPCGTDWKFDLPTATSCCSTNIKITSTGLATNGVCPKVITQTWRITDGCGNTATCSQTVTVVDKVPPVLTCPTNRIFVALDTGCQLEIPTIRPPASDDCTPVSLLVYTQEPLAGTVVPGPCQLVTVTVRDGCDNSTQCQVLVCGRDKTPPVLVYPKSVTVTNCMVPNVLALVSASDNCTASNQLVFTQSPPAGSPIAAGGNQVSVTVTDVAGNTTTCIIPLSNGGPQFFLNVLFNTGVDNNKVVLGTGAYEIHYTLGPVPIGTPTGPNAYNAPNAVVLSSGWGWPLPPFTLSGWIVPYLPYAGAPVAAGSYTYTNRFILPSGTDPLTASISGRWAADGGANMYLNGLASANQVSAPITPPGYNQWTYFTINSGFLAFPAVNELYCVVTNGPGFGNDKFPALRVELTDAAINCSTCAPPVILRKMPNQSKPLNSTAVFSVSVGGTPPFGIQWYRNGLPLSNGGHYSGVNTTTLTVTPLNYADAGIYYVVISNSCGETRSNSAKLTITHGWPWWWEWWNFDHIGRPMVATFGRDLILEGTNTFGISSGTTRDFDLPSIGGQIANVMYVPPLPGDTLIELPSAIRTSILNSNSVSCYTLIMDVYVPGNSTARINLFEVFPDGIAGQNRLSLSSNPGIAGQVLTLGGTVGGTPVNIIYPPALSQGGNPQWSRVALVVGNAGSTLDTGEVTLSLYVNGAPGASASFNAPPGALAFHSNSLATVFSSPDGTACESYVSSIQFHSAAMTPEIIAGIGGPDDGPIPASDASVGPSPVLTAATSNGTVNLSWTDSGFLLQETLDLTNGVWVDSELPFDQNEVNGGILTTSHAYPPLQGPTRFYRLVSRP